MAVTKSDIGKMYRVPWSPNPHKLVRVQPRHCSLHGEFIGMEALFLKKRNSDIRPWGSALHCVMATDERITPWEDPAS